VTPECRYRHPHSVRLRVTDARNSLEQVRERGDVQRCTGPQHDEHLIRGGQRVFPVQRKPVVLEQTIHVRVTGRQFPIHESLHPFLIRGGLQHQAVRFRQAEGVNAIDVHDGIARAQAVRVEYLDERGVVGVDQLCGNRDVAVAAGSVLQLAEREASGIFTVQDTQLVRHPRVVDARLQGARRGSRIAGCEHHGSGEQERNTHI